MRADIPSQGLREYTSHDNQRCQFGVRSASGIFSLSSTPSVLGASVVAPLQTSVFSALSRTSSTGTSLTSTDVQNSSLQIVTNSGSSNLIVDGASARWIKCSVASCYTVFFSIATARRCTLCSDGIIHS